jgi:hypothetical protein
MTLLLLHHKIKKCQIKKIKGTDRPIKDIFNFQFKTFVSTVMAHLIEELVTKSWPVTAPGSQGVFGA